MSVFNQVVVLFFYTTLYFISILLLFFRGHLCFNWSFSLLDFGYLLINYLFKVKAIPDFIINLMINSRKHILHVHDGVIEAQILAKRRIRGLPTLQNAFFVFLLLSFAHLL